MRNQEIKAAIANIDACAKGLEAFINKPENYNCFASSLMEQAIIELKRQASSINDIEYMFGW